MEEVLKKLDPAEVTTLLRLLGSSHRPVKETRFKIQAGTRDPAVTKSALAANVSPVTTAREDPRQCYNCGKTGHISTACPRPPKERDFRGRGCGQGRSGRGVHCVNLGIGGSDKKSVVIYTEEEQTLLSMISMMQGLKRRQAGEISKSGTGGLSASAIDAHPSKTSD